MLDSILNESHFILVDASWSSWSQSACINPNIVETTRIVRQRTCTGTCTEGADRDDWYGCQNGCKFLLVFTLQGFQVSKNFLYKSKYNLLSLVGANYMIFYNF